MREALDAVLPALGRPRGRRPHGRGRARDRAGREPRRRGRPAAERLAEALNASLPADVAVVARGGGADGLPRALLRRSRARTATSSSTGASGRRSRHGARSGGRGRSTTTRSPPCGRSLPGSTTSARSRRPRRSTRCFRREIRDAAWERRGDELHFTVTADSFLRHMVRTLVGTMLEAPEAIARAARGAPARRGGHDRAAVGPLPRARRVPTSGRQADPTDTGSQSVWHEPDTARRATIATCASPSSSSTSTAR